MLQFCNLLVKDTDDFCREVKVNMIKFI